MNWKKLPSLTMLRAFEAAARHGSFTEAARELNVTDAAIRQQVRALETHLDIRLIERDGRGMTSTPLGAKFFMRLTHSFERIQEAVNEIRNESETQVVRVALTPTFAESWLIPRLPEFWEEYPDIQIDLSPSIKNVDLKAEKFNLAIRYGDGHWPGAEKHFLASADYTVVASPHLPGVFPATKPETLTGAVWLFEKGRSEHEEWAVRHGVAFDAPRNRLYSNNSLVLSAVKAGHGYAVQSYSLVERDLLAGTLIQISREPSNPLGYYILCAEKQRGNARIFIDWMLCQKR
ncbi:MAG: LysR substrate-binding domain-containing protein [Sneathiella sp.]